MRKFPAMLVALALNSLTLCAQVNGTAQLGFSRYQGDLHCITDNDINLFNNLGASAGIGIHIPFTKSIGLRGDLTYFRLSGEEADFADSGHAARGWSFTNNMLELTGSLDWEILGHRRFKHGRFRRILTPVIFGGVGLGFTNTNVNWNNQLTDKIVQDQVYDKNAELVIPIGIGLKYYYSTDLALELQGGWRLPVSDYYDGVSRAGNPRKDDSYGFTGFKVFFAINGKLDEDGDGIVDADDQCPNTPGLKSLGGCPDSDFDGIADKEDNCPFTQGLPDLGGCPDGDFDGVPDAQDVCPMVAGPIEFSGCPDQDGDGIIDRNDLCPTVAAVGSKSGCPDRDGDGIADDYDLCPDKAGTAADGGCPSADSDFDGVADHEDDCPNFPGTALTKGCPDDDGDGIANQDDSCPNLKGDQEFDGCPEGVIPFPTEMGIAMIIGEQGQEQREIVKKSPQRCDCTQNTHPVFSLPNNSLNSRKLKKLGSYPEFGNVHDLDAAGFFYKLRKAYDTNAADKIFLDGLFQAMGYSAGFAEVNADYFWETEIPYGTSGNIGYSKDHKTQYATLTPTSDLDLLAFRIQAANGCDIYFMKTCGNHFFFCP